MSVELPSGWRTMELKEVLDTLPSGSQVQQGWSPQCDSEEADEREWGVLKTTAVQAGKFLPQHNKRLPAHFKEREALEVRAGDLLLTNAGPRARCAVPTLVRHTRPRLMLSGKIYRFRPRVDLVDSEFLELYLLTPGAQKQLDAMKTGISDSGLNLTRGRFLALAVPVPPLVEQRRIVDILAGHLSRLDAAQRSLRVADQKLALLMSASAEYAKRDAATSCESSNLASLAVDARYGTSTKCVVDGPGPAVVRIPNLVAGRIELTDEKRVEDPSVDVAAAMLRVDDLLVVRTNGSRQLIGRTAVVQPGVDAAFASYLIRYRLDPARVRSGWVSLMMLSPSTRAVIETMAASSAGQYNLSLSKLGGIRLPVPSLATQDRLLGADRSLSEAAVRAVAESQAAVRRGVALRRGVMTAAFSAQLS